MELSAFLHLGLVALDENAEKVGGLRLEHQPQLGHANRERFFRVQRQLTQFVLKAFYPKNADLKPTFSFFNSSATRFSFFNCPSSMMLRAIRGYGGFSLFEVEDCVLQFLPLAKLLSRDLFT